MALGTRWYVKGKSKGSKSSGKFANISNEAKLDFLDFGIKGCKNRKEGASSSNAHHLRSYVNVICYNGVLTKPITYSIRTKKNR